MFNKLFIAALFAASPFTAKAQSIKIVKTCGEPTTIVQFVQTDAYSNPIKGYSVGSQCVTQEFPNYYLGVGNYEFKNLPIPEYEEWFCEIKEAGKLVKKGFLTRKEFDVVLKEDMTILIIIAPKPQRD